MKIYVVEIKKSGFTTVAEARSTKRAKEYITLCQKLYPNKRYEIRTSNMMQLKGAVLLWQLSK